MENEQYQKELFDEFKKPRKTLPGFIKIFSRTDFEQRMALTITLEQLIFILIGAIMLAVIVYAVGVERGKSLKSALIAASTKAVTGKNVPKSMPGTVNAPATLAPVQKTGTAAKQKVSSTQIPAVKAYYTIIVYSYSSKETAVLQVNYLKRAGFDAYISQMGQYFTVCIGKFSTKESAQGTLSNVQRSIRKDAYIKYRQ